MKQEGTCQPEIRSTGALPFNLLRSVHNVPIVRDVWFLCIQLLNIYLQRHRLSLV